MRWSNPRPKGSLPTRSFVLKGSACGVQACCGMSIVFGDEAEVERARKYAAKEALAVTEFVRVESVPNPRRDRFC